MANNNNYFPTQYQEFIHLSRYARWIEDLGRRETWEETVDRYMTYMFDEKCAGKIDQGTRNEVREAILNLEVMPSMRCLMTAGPALKRDEAAGYNCFSGNQRFYTHDGLKSFSDTCGTKQMVIDGNGNWSEAEIKSFGRQKLQTVLFKPGMGVRSKTNIRHSVTVTPDHRWITDRGEVTDLKVGDTVPFNPFVGDDDIDVEAWIRGFGFGDGTIDNRGRAKVRLCGEKDMQWIERFEKYGHSGTMYPPSYGGDAVVLYHKGYMTDWKELPHGRSGDSKYMKSWLEGYLAADGHLNDRQPGLSSQNSEAIKFVMEIAPVAGYVVTGHNISTVMETNFGTRKAPLIRITLRKSGGFKVTDIIPLEDEDEVFCAVVPSTGSFSLENGILTGNCSYLAVDSVRAFDEALYLLMCGAGVGFSVERQFIDRLPTVADRLRPSKTTIVVEDSKVGWANAFTELVSMLYMGRIPNWDVSKVREAGAKLKTFGGRSSGPAPLVELFEFAVSIFKMAAGRKLNSLECHDLMCKIGEIVVVGGVRRSALISLSNLTDDRMRHAKSGEWWKTEPQRALANNSACYTEKPEAERFLREWLALMESKCGERGIFNREAARKVVEKSGRRDPDHEFGCNPSLRKGTRVWTSDGVVPIEDLEGKEFTVRNLDGRLSTAKCWMSGSDKPLYRLSIKGGHEYYATAEHKWPVLDSSGNVKKVNTCDLEAGMSIPLLSEGVDTLTNGEWGDSDLGFLMGWNIGDGWRTVRSDNGKVQFGFIVSDEDRMSAIDERIERTLRRHGSKSSFGESGELNVVAMSVSDIFERAGYGGKSEGLPSIVWDEGSEDFRRGLIDGIFSSDGCFSDGVSMSTAKERLARDIADLLGFYGIKTTVKKVVRNNVTFPNGVDYEKEYTLWYVQVRHHASALRFHSIFSISHVGKQNRLSNFVSRDVRPSYVGKTRISSVELTDLKEDVWDISVADETHCFQLAHCVTGNCSEIILRSCGFCNLSEVVARADDTPDDLERKIRLATIIGTVQSTLTDFRYLRPVWRENSEEECLLGVSITGVMDNEFLAGKNGKKKLSDALDGFREYAISVNKEWSKKLGVNQSVAITCNKPSGTVSQLVDSASGIHPRMFPYYIRTVRADKKDPLAQMMMDIGFPYEDELNKPESVAVFKFPFRSPEGATCAADLTAIEQLELWRVYQRHWTEHKPSITVYVRDHEWVEVGSWVYKNFDEISGVSFLPYSGHNYKQAPYQEISEETYHELLNEIPQDVDWAMLQAYEIEDTTVGQKTLACSAGNCDDVAIGNVK